MKIYGQLESVQMELLQGFPGNAPPARIYADNTNPSNIVPMFFNGTAWVQFTLGGVPGGGTVTAVGLSMPAVFNVAGSPITAAGTLNVSLATQTANKIWAGPTSGAAAAPTFRTLVAADLPAGLLAITVVTKTGAYTASPNDVVLADATAVGFTIALPSAASNPNAIIYAKKIDSSAHPVVVAAPGAETVDGIASVSFVGQNQGAMFVSDGANWFIF
jgi:hypothetical protein